MDVSKPFVDTLWIGTMKEYGWEISLAYEGNHAYCEYCGLLGHTIELCWKKRMVQGKAINGETTNNTIQANKGIRRPEKERWVPKNGTTGNAETQQQDCNTIKMPSHNKTVILTNTQNGINSEAKQELIRAGLISESEASGSKRNNHDSLRASQEYNLHMGASLHQLKNDIKHGDTVLSETLSNNNDDAEVQQSKAFDFEMQARTNQIFDSNSALVLHPEIEETGGDGTH